jgi:DNA-binding CsgD family transcriptional regulator
MPFLKHIGVKRRSGRYPWGSGKNPEQRNKSFLGYVEQLKKEGLTEVQIAEGLGMSTTQLRTRKSIAKNEVRSDMIREAQKLKDKGMSNVAIGEKMGLNESSIRALLDPTLKARSDIAVSTASMLRDQVEKKGLIDVGGGVESHIGISKTKLNTALSLLEEEGYGIHYVKVKQLGTGKDTTIRVLSAPGVPYKEVFKNQSDIKTVTDYTENGGRSFLGLEPIQNVSRSRIMIRYAEDGGKDKDGVLELRRGVDDISLGKARYAQVRVGVEGGKYMKGMAIYADKLPAGIDIIYNTNKKRGTSDEKVFKQVEDDPDNPFGTIVRQQHYLTEAGKKIPNAKEMLEMKQASEHNTYKDIAQRFGVDESTVKKAITVKAVNIVNEEGDWQDWSRSISSQVLSKQSPALAKKQLDLDKDIRQEEFDEIMSLTNPTVKKTLLKTFSDEADSAAVHLKAAALPRQANKVILPVPSMKPNEVYAPSFDNGENVVLIRHPHGGIFEIPELKVNNKNPEAISILGKTPIDGIGIHPKVAEKLSGADFDGDTVLIIPNNHKLIQTAPTLKALKDFDTKEAYPPYDGMPTMDGGRYDEKSGKVDYGGKKPNTATKQRQMGDVSNLITDMTIKGATPDEIARAVKHSMVVIDAEKHHLDYKKSAIDNGISELKTKYQGGPRAGASTLISKAKSEMRVPARVEGKFVADPVTGKTKRVYIDPKTGKKLYENTGETFINSKGKLVVKTTLSTKMAEETNAFKLSSGTKIENVYAEYANSLKEIANKARKAMIETPDLVYSPSAKKTYATEVARLKAALRVANMNRPMERQAQLLANKIVRMKKDSNPNLDPGDIKKIKGQALEEARYRTKAKKEKITISDREWEAIQLGAISNTVLSKILANTNLKAIKERATPRTAYVMTPAKVAKAKALAANGLTTAEIASSLGVSVTTVQNTIT